MAAALRYLQIFTTRASCMVRSHLLQLLLAPPEAGVTGAADCFTPELLKDPSIHPSRIITWCVLLLCDRMRPGPQLKTGRTLLLSRAPMSLWLHPLPPRISPPFTPTHPVWRAGDQSKATTMWWFHGSLSDGLVSCRRVHTFCVYMIWFTETRCKSDIHYVYCRRILEVFFYGNNIIFLPKETQISMMDNLTLKRFVCCVVEEGDVMGLWLIHDRMLGDSVIPLPHIYGARIKGVEVFCPLDPPPPYEAVAAEAVTQVDKGKLYISPNFCCTNVKNKNMFILPLPTNVCSCFTPCDRAMFHLCSRSQKLLWLSFQWVGLSLLQAPHFQVGCQHWTSDWIRLGFIGDDVAITAIIIIGWRNHLLVRSRLCWPLRGVPVGLLMQKYQQFSAFWSWVQP